MLHEVGCKYIVEEGEACDDRAREERKSRPQQHEQHRLHRLQRRQPCGGADGFVVPQAPVQHQVQQGLERRQRQHRIRRHRHHRVGNEPDIHLRPATGRAAEQERADNRQGREGQHQQIKVVQGLRQRHQQQGGHQHHCHQRADHEQREVHPVGGCDCQPRTEGVQQRGDAGDDLRCLAGHPVAGAKMTRHKEGPCKVKDNRRNARPRGAHRSQASANEIGRH